MTWILITLPLMVVAVAIATVPVLYWSVREHRHLHGQPAIGHRATPAPSAYWTRSVSHQDIRARRGEDRP
jgi:hypothetical protein